MPHLEETIAQFEYLVCWKKAAGGDEDIPEPRQGLDEGFDNCNNQVDRIKHHLHELLHSVKQTLSTSSNQPARIMNQVNYVHGRYRYEIEVPVELV